MSVSAILDDMANHPLAVIAAASAAAAFGSDNMYNNNSVLSTSSSSSSSINAEYARMLHVNHAIKNNSVHSFDSVKDYLKTGDLLVFHGEGAISAAFKFLTGSSATHIGIVYRNRKQDCASLPDKELYMLEAYTGDDGVVDVISNQKGVECRLVLLRDRLVGYRANKIVIRQLLCFNATDLQRIEQRMYSVICQAQREIVYDLNPFHYLDAIERNLFDVSLDANAHSFGHHHGLLLGFNHVNEFAAYNDSAPGESLTNRRGGSDEVHKAARYCSALVAYVYRSLGIFKNVQNSGGLHDRDFFPKHFTSEFDQSDLPFAPNYHLSPYEPMIELSTSSSSSYGSSSGSSSSGGPLSLLSLRTLRDAEEFYSVVLEDD